ncbi:MAG: type II secretion system protein GspG [Verrucomicrobiota bacterium]|nr:type II secretion system protein GspG [Verrucomicrobiota bacterium]
MSQFVKRGFTLIELVVVLGIISILVTILFTSFSYFHELQKTKKAKMEIAALKTAVESYRTQFGALPNCKGEVCTPSECLFLSLAGYHNVDGTLEIPPYPSTIPTDLFSYDLNSFDLGEIPDLSHGGGNSIMIWLAETLGKDPAFLDPWGQEYVYEYPEEGSGVVFTIYSKGPDGKTGEEFSSDDIR